MYSFSSSSDFTHSNNNNTIVENKSGNGEVDRKKVGRDLGFSLIHNIKATTRTS